MLFVYLTSESEYQKADIATYCNVCLCVNVHVSSYHFVLFNAYVGE